MSMFTQTLVAASVTAALLGSTAAGAEWSANVGVTSNYIWRGVTQTDDSAAVSGGIDYGHASGFYAGGWTSNLSGAQYELDLYLGYAGEAAGLSYDVGAIQYLYPVDDNVEADFAEVYGSVGYGPLTGSVAYTVSKEADVDDENDLYYALSAEFPVKQDLTVGLLVGSYDFDDPAAEDYTHYQVSLTKGVGDFGDFTFALDKASDYVDGTTVEEDPRVWVSWSKSLDL